MTAGTVTRGELRGPAFLQLFRDVYACSELLITHEVRAVAAARLLVPGSTVTGRSALALWGLATEPDRYVELTVPGGSPVRRCAGCPASSSAVGTWTREPSLSAEAS